MSGRPLFGQTPHATCFVQEHDTIYVSQAQPTRPEPVSSIGRHTSPVVTKLIVSPTSHAPMTTSAAPIIPSSLPLGNKDVHGRTQWKVCGMRAPI